jgi:hypothetical protein
MHGLVFQVNTDINRSQIMWANSNWPIANFAPIHPTGQVGLGSDNHTKTLARNTVWLVNNHTNWHGVNGAETPFKRYFILKPEHLPRQARDKHRENSQKGTHLHAGICLSWPSASRLMDKKDPYPFGPSTLLDKFEAALRATMQPNFWPSMGGGGLEQVGATQVRRKRVFLRRFVLKLIISPRKARDKHRGKAPKTHAFSCRQSTSCFCSRSRAWMRPAC